MHPRANLGFALLLTLASVPSAHAEGPIRQPMVTLGSTALKHGVHALHVEFLSGGNLGSSGAGVVCRWKGETGELDEEWVGDACAWIPGLARPVLAVGNEIHLPTRGPDGAPRVIKPQSQPWPIYASKERVAANVRNEVQVWDLDGELKGVSQGFVKAFSNVSSRAAISDRNRITILDLKSYERLGSVSPEGDAVCCFTATGSHLVVVESPDLHIDPLAPPPKFPASVSLLDIERGKADESFEVDDIRPSVAAVSAKGDLLAIGTHDGKIQLFEFPAGKRIRTLQTKGYVSSLDFSADGKRIAAAALSVVVWELATGKPILSPQGHAGPVTSVGFTGIGQVVETLSTYDQTHLKWDLTGREIARAEPGSVPVAFSSATASVAWQSPEGIAWLDPDKKQQKLVSRTKYDMHHFSPDGSVVIGVLRKTGSAWISTPPHKDPHQVELTRPTYAASVSRQGEWIAAGGVYQCEVWAAKGTAPEVKLPIEEVSATEFTPDGKELIVALLNGRIEIWDWKQARKLKTFPQNWFKRRPDVTPLGYPASLRLAISTDGALLVAGAEDGAVRVWDLKTGEVCDEFAAHRGNVLCLAFSPDRKLLVTGGLDGVARVWRLSSR